MGHYDSSRPGYCAGCGAAPGNIINGVCEFCGPKSKGLKGRVVKPQPLRLRGGPRTTVPEKKLKTPVIHEVEVPDLTDFRGTIAALMAAVMEAGRTHGYDKYIRVDAGHNNVEFVVEIPEE